MSTNKQALRQLAVDAKELAIIKRYTKGVEAQKKFIAAANPATVMALLDELEAAEKRIAELGGHLKSAHAFIENTEAFGHEAASGILKCGDSEWNVDASKESLAAAGISVKGE